MSRITSKNCVKICVRGGQGSPQGPDMECGQAETHGSTMNRCAQVRLLPGRYSRKPLSKLRSSQFWPSLACPAFPCTPVGQALFKRGQTAETQEDYDTAFNDYQKALAKAPKDLTYRTALIRVRVSASAMHMTKGRKLLAGRRRTGRIGGVHSCL